MAHYSATGKNPTNEARCPIAGFLSFGRVLRERKRILWNSFRWPRLIKVPLSSPTKGDLLPHFAFPEEIYILVNCVKLRESIFFFQFKAFKVFFKIVNSNAREKRMSKKKSPSKMQSFHHLSARRVSKFFEEASFRGKKGRERIRLVGEISGSTWNPVEEEKVERAPSSPLLHGICKLYM